MIITIIVMLILVAVSVQVLVKSDLIGTTEKVADEYKIAYEEEGNMGGVTINGKDYASIGDYIEGVEKVEEVHNWQYTDNTMVAVKCVCSECKKVNAEGQTINIGQEVAYTNAEDIEWVVFGVEDKNKNGTNEGLLITTLEPSSETLTLKGADAYNTGIADINAKCKELYGEEARGMTIEDVNRTLGYTPAGGMYVDESGIHVLDGFETQLNTLDIWDDIKAYNVAECEGKYYTPDYPEGTTDETVLGNVKIDGYLYSVEYDETGLPYVPETTSGVVKTLVFGESYNLFYLLASRGRGIIESPNYVSFGPGAVSAGGAFSCGNLFNSKGRTGAFPVAVRPVVSLISEIPELGEILVSEGTTQDPD